MKRRMSVITLGVADMDRAVAFYRDGLGLPHRDDKPPVAYFELDGTWLALFPTEGLAGYAGRAADGAGFRGVMLSVNVDTAADVDRTLEEAAAAGATVRPAKTMSWGGHVGWFEDPDGHVWEVVWNPRPFMPY